MELVPNHVHHVPLRGVNAYIVDRRGVTLIDAGTPWDGSRLRDALAAADLSRADVDRVLVTHYDLDHVGALASLDLDVPVYLAEPDASYLRGTRSPPLENHKGAFQRLSDRVLTRPDNPVRTVTDGDRIKGFTAYRTPGHTPGHVAYVHDDLGVAFLGDLVRAADGALEPLPWPLTYDTDRNERSIRELADRAPDFPVAAPGHGDPLREGGSDALGLLADSLAIAAE